MPTVRTNGIETYYERRGEGPSAVFVHAAILDHSMWDRQVAALSDDYETVVYDLRGHGRTGGSDAPAYSVDRYVADLHALVEALELDRPALCGHSLGGMIAQAYAARYPDEIAGLVLADVMLTDTFEPGVRHLGEWVLRRVVLPALVPPVGLFGYDRVERANVWLTDRLFGGVAGDYGNVERVREAGTRMTTDEFVKAIRAMERFRGPLDLSPVVVPALVLYGENELPFVVRHAAELAARLPDATVDRVPGGGHASNLDDPEYYAAAVRSLLERAYPDGGVEARPESGDAAA